MVSDLGRALQHAAIPRNRLGARSLGSGVQDDLSLKRVRFLGFRVLGFWGLGFRLLGFRLLGFRVLGFWGLGFRVYRV